MYNLFIRYCFLSYLGERERGGYYIILIYLNYILIKYFLRFFYSVLIHTELINHI